MCGLEARRLGGLPITATIRFPGFPPGFASPVSRCPSLRSSLPVSRFPSGFRAVLSRRVSCSILRALLRALLLSTLPLPLPFIFLSLFFAFPLARHFSLLFCFLFCATGVAYSRWLSIKLQIPWFSGRNPPSKGDFCSFMRGSSSDPTTRTLPTGKPRRGAGTIEGCMNWDC